MMQPQLIETPIYGRSEASRLIRVMPATVKRWIDGYQMKRHGVLIHYPAWFERSHDDLLSFTDLIELWFVQQFLDHGVPLTKIRTTYRTMRDRLHTDHPFVSQKHWFAVGKNLIAAKYAEDPDAEFLEPCSGQLFLEEVAKRVGQQVEFDPDTFLACRWYPLGKGEPVQVDPRICSGVPAIKGRRLTTKDVVGLWTAEGKQDDVVLEAFGITKEELKAALAWERLIRKN